MMDHVDHKIAEPLLFSDWLTVFDWKTARKWRSCK